MSLMKEPAQDTVHRGDLEAITTYQAGVAQASVNRMLRKVSDRALKPFGLTKMQWMAIGCILDAGKQGTRITDLANVLDTTLPYLTNMMNQLESRGIIIKKYSQRDGRSKLVFIRPEFVPQCANIEATLRQALRESIYSHVDPHDFRIYMKVMYELYNIR